MGLLIYWPRVWGLWGEERMRGEDAGKGREGKEERERDEHLPITHRRAMPSSLTLHLPNVGVASIEEIPPDR